MLMRFQLLIATTSSVRSTSSASSNLLSRPFVQAVGHRLGRREFGQFFGPFQGDAFAFAVELRLAPRRQHVQALLGFPRGARVLAVHVQAERAAVDLRDAHQDQLDKRRFQSPGVLDVLSERDQRLHGGVVALHGKTVHGSLLVMSTAGSGRSVQGRRRRRIRDRAQTRKFSGCRSAWIAVMRSPSHSIHMAKRACRGRTGTTRAHR
jgi:hypothetical protein